MISLRWIVFSIGVSVLYLTFISTDKSNSNVDPQSNSKESNIKVEPLDSESDKPKVDRTLKEPSSKTDDEVIEREEEAIKLDGLNVAQIREMREKAEKFQFQAEVDRMMKLIINSLYTNKEIFLRELISNASDALDKLRFLSLTDPSAMGDFSELSIKIKADRINNILRITDTGVGMTRNELIKQLGTIANSGTTEFIAKMEQEKSSNIGDFIGQFGVGFYSVYLVSESVTVISKSNDDDQYIWESDSSNTFTVTKDPRGNTLKRGTEVVLRLKASAHEYLEAENLKRLVKQYSQYLSFPIYLWSSQTVTTPAVVSPLADTGTDESPTDENKKSDSDKAKSKPSPTVKWDWERINNNKPIWTRKSSDITDEEYDDFFKSLTKSSEQPLAKIHFNAEGEVSFKALLYIPTTVPPNFLEKEIKESSIRLYVRRVFITDKIVDIIPRYLSFLVGIVDSDDLPLNVSRETLQQEKLMKVIQKKLVRKALDMIKKMPREQFDKFWASFRPGIKLGLIEDDTNRNRLTKIIHTMTSKFENETTSLADYVSRMRSQQDEIFLVCGETLDQAKDSLFAEKYVKNGYEVLYFTDALDEHALFLIEKFDGIKLVNLARGIINFDKTEGGKDILRRKRQDFRPLIDFIEREVIGFKEKIENIVITDRLLSAPMAIVPNDQGWTGNMERLAKAQSGKREEAKIINDHISMKKNLELNAKHPILRKLNTAVSSGGSNDESGRNLVRLVRILFDTTLLNCGYHVNDTNSYATNVDDAIDILYGKKYSLDEIDDYDNMKSAMPASDEENQGMDDDEGYVEGNDGTESTFDSNQNKEDEKENPSDKTEL